MKARIAGGALAIAASLSLIGSAMAQSSSAHTSSAGAAASSSSSGGSSSAVVTSDGQTIQRDERGCRIIRRSESGNGPSTTITTSPNGSVSGSTSSGSSGSGVSVQAGGGHASADCYVVRPDEPRR